MLKGKVVYENEIMKLPTTKIYYIHAREVTNKSVSSFKYCSVHEVRTQQGNILIY